MIGRSTIASMDIVYWTIGPWFLCKTCTFRITPNGIAWYPEEEKEEKVEKEKKNPEKKIENNFDTSACTKYEYI